MAETNIDEDEDVVLQGSPLHEYLSKLGYMDFERMPIQKVTPEKINGVSFLTVAIDIVKNVYRKLHFMCSFVIGEEELSQRQLTTILGAKCLLDDHVLAISNSINEQSHRIWRHLFQELLFLCGIASPICYLSATEGISLSNFAIIYGVFLMCCTKYLRFCAYNNLKNFISTQNQTFDLCRRAIRILAQDFRMKSDSVRNCQRFNDLTSGKLSYLQPLTENLIKCMELFISTNYEMSMHIMKILPEDSTAAVPTTFDKKSLNLCGKITYKKLMNFYHIYVLTQSEMLHALGIAYDIKIWQRLLKHVPELKLFHIVRFMNNKIKCYKINLTNATDAYCNFKVIPIRYRYIIPKGSKLQDLSMHLDLTSQKIEIAHYHVASILNYINQAIDASTTNEAVNKLISENLEEAGKQIDIAKQFLEFGRLRFAKETFKDESNLSIFLEVQNMDELSKNPCIETKPNTSLEFDTVPQTVDEVFEEYIEEEYLKPMQEESIGSFDIYKLDKFLARNFMGELKDRLVEVKKSMTERETVALRRSLKSSGKLKADNCQHKSIELTGNDFNEKYVQLKTSDHEKVLKDDIENDSNNSVDTSHFNIPIPPTMCNLNISILSRDLSFNKESNITLSCSKKCCKTHVKDTTHDQTVSDCRDKQLIEEESGIQNKENQGKVELKSEKDSNRFLMQLPPVFLSEETFEGSGENSETEEIENNVL